MLEWDMSSPFTCVDTGRRVAGFKHILNDAFERSDNSLMLYYFENAWPHIVAKAQDSLQISACEVAEAPVASHD